MGLTGAALGFALQTWVHTSAYPLVISGKPYFSWPAFIPITFELGVLFESEWTEPEALGEPFDPPDTSGPCCHPIAP